MSTERSAAASAWPLMLTAAAILMITMGLRQTTGLFVSPLNTSTGLGIVSISFALAIGQFVWGAAQPVFGAIGDKYGPFRVLVVGGLLLALGTALTPFAKTEWQLMLTMGLLTAAGAGAGSFSLLIGATAQRIPADKRSFAAGFVNAGGSFGQFLFAPLVQLMIGATGWVGAMLAMAAVSLLTIPLAFLLRAPAEPVDRAAGTMPGGTHNAAAASTAPPSTASPTASPTASSPSTARSAVPPATTVPAAPSLAVDRLGQQLKIALRNPSYLLLHAGFFTCGFHIAFLVTHLPSEVGLCGLPATVASASLALIGLFNIAGSLTIGWMGQRYRMKLLLAWMYGSRAVAIALYLMAPKTPMTFYVFAAVLGFTWLATVPPTAGLVGKLFGTRYLSTLFGLTLLSHQIGGFLGAWLGGVTIARDGNYNWMWYADIVLALAAALVNLPIREAPVPRRVVAA